MQDPSIPSITRNDAILYSNTNNTLLNTLNNVNGGSSRRRRRRTRKRGGQEPLYKQSGTDINVVNANMADTGAMQAANSNAFINPVIKSLFGGRRRGRKTRRKQTKKRRRQRTRK